MEENCYKNFFNIFIPVVYLFVWFLFLLFCKQFGIFDEVADIRSFLAISFLVMFFGMITKSTSWKIGNRFFEIGGDSKRHIEYSWHENWEKSNAEKSGFTVKIDHDDPGVIAALMDKHHELENRR